MRDTPVLVSVSKNLSEFMRVRAYSRKWKTLFGGVFGYEECKVTWGEEICIPYVFRVRNEL